MTNNNQKYVISEFFKFEADRNLILEAEKNNDLITLVGILQKADTLNRNGRIYPYEILKREAEKYMELVDMKTAYGELDHPSDAVVSLVNVSHMVTDMWWEGKTLYGKVVIFDENPAGQVLKGILKKGGTLGISSRGVGSVKSVNGNDIVQDDFELIAFDFVSSPSTPGAYMFKEGVDKAKKGMIKIDTGTENISEIQSNIDKYKNIIDGLGNDFWKKI